MSEHTQQSDQLSPHILVVDDETDILQMVAICLHKINYLVTCAESPSDACNLLQLEQYDAIISDVMMPGEDGIAFLGKVHELWPEIPVILMTGHAQLQMAVNAIKNGAFDFIHKPFDFEHLRKIVERAVNYRNLQRLEKNYRAELEQTVAERTAELKESMAELDFARSALQQAATEKSTFMSTVSHEMRTPMNGVIGSLELLAEENLSGSAAEYLAMTRQAADDMMLLINQLLSFTTKNNSADGSACRHLVDLKAFFQKIVAAQLPLFNRKGVLLSLQLAEDLPVQIWSDREKLCRLIEILLGNALKFTEKGSVSISVSIKGEDLLCSVTDSGIGIPDGMLERVFEPFVQGDSSFSRRHEGVGLGLAIARQNALLLDGKLWAEHVVEGGSRFMLTMKIKTP